MKYTFAHYNGTDPDWVESGPYIHGWFNTYEEADNARNDWRKNNPSSDGWRSRTVVLDEDEYRRS